MARDYAALPHEYLEEMEELSDAAFGRLCRALLRYSISGEETQLRGPERLFLKRIFHREQRYQANYDKQIEARREAGKKGAAARWQNAAVMAKPCAGMADDCKPDQAEAKTKTKAKSETKDDVSHPSGGPVGPSMSAAAFFLERISPTASPATLEALAEFERDLGTEVCVRAMTAAQEAGNASWRYIRGILRNKRRQGVRSLAAWDEAERERRKESIHGTKDTGEPPPEYRVGQWL